MPCGLGLLRLERILLTGIFLALAYALLSFSISQLGFVNCRSVLALARAGSRGQPKDGIVRLGP
jgi:hypothetical protein